MGWASDLKTIDSKGIREALELSVDTGKPIDQCINEMAEISTSRQLDTNQVNLFEPEQWKPK